MKNFTFLSLILLFLIETQNIYAKESTFTVDNILVSSELTNINNSSREKYLNIGFKKGFKNLVINLLRKEDQKKILIENYRVVEEKRLDNKYILKLSITFDKNKTKQFFYEKSIPYSESKNLQVILYPILILGSELQVFSENNFFEEWNDNKDFENIDFILPVENIEDINFLKKNVKILDEIELSNLVVNYEFKNSSIFIL